MLNHQMNRFRNQVWIQRKSDPEKSFITLNQRQSGTVYSTGTCELGFIVGPCNSKALIFPTTVISYL